MTQEPIIEQEALNAASRITKIQWIELYRDLYLQTHGEDTGMEWIGDARGRLVILQINGVSSC